MSPNAYSLAHLKALESVGHASGRGREKLKQADFAGLWTQSGAVLELWSWSRSPMRFDCNLCCNT